MNEDQPSHSPQAPRQQTLTFLRNRVGPILPKAANREIRDLLVQMLVDIVGHESEPPPRGGEYEREDP